MNFEDIVDMDWVDSHTSSSPVVKEEELFPTDLAPDYYGQGDFLQPSPAPKDAMDMKMEPNVPLAMPTTEQIKQLIDIAKRQLALRDQQPLQTIFSPQGPHGATMPDTVAPESLIKQVRNKSRRASSVSSSGGDEALSFEAYGEMDSMDVKKLSPKERRQLRNKISARNFRVRRKEYITNLEQRVDEHKKVADDLALRLGQVEEENKQLREEVDSLRKQNQLLQQQPSSSTASTAPHQTPTAPASPSSSPLLSSHLPKPNLNKDIGVRGTKASDTFRQDTSILVSSAVMPAWNFADILAQPLPSMEPDHTVCAADVLQCCARRSVTHPKATKASHGCAERTLFPPPPMPHRHKRLSEEWTAQALYDMLQRSLLNANPASGSNDAKVF